MARRTYVYRKDKDGNVRPMLLNERMEYRPGKTAESFGARIRATLYQLECREGSRFQIPGYNNKTLKRVWNAAV